MLEICRNKKTGEIGMRQVGRSLSQENVVTGQHEELMNTKYNYSPWCAIRSVMENSSRVSHSWISRGLRFSW